MPRSVPLATVARTAADLAWKGLQAVNTRLPESPSPNPDWAPGPLAKSRERTMPELGWPRETDSLCPDCTIETRDAIVAGERDLTELTEKGTGEIRATILEEDGRVLIRKTCPTHGTYEDTLSIDPELRRVLERRFYGRDFRAQGDEHLHRHGSSTIQYGRGAVLTVDLTNRCNMMCDPCFMDANQVGYVHELTLEEIREILDDSLSFKPRRQMSVQYSGGEPTISPHFLEACRYAKEIGYYSVQAASNGLRFALEPDFAEKAAEAGLDMVYLQFDGVTDEANSHRHVTNLFAAKKQAMARIHEAGIDITPVTTVVNTVNDDQVGPILDFVIENSHMMGAVSFQPVSFTGRDEEITDERRRRQRYTISHLARELEEYTDGKIDPHRDFYPLGSAGAYTWLADHLRGTDVEMGGLSCSCHPNCGASVMLAVNQRTKEWAPLTQFFDAESFIEDIDVICDTARGKRLTVAQAGLAILRHTDPSAMPDGLTLRGFIELINSKLGGTMTGERRELEWKIVWVGGMWFQDLWTYDFRRTEMCVIPYATQEGEISFCAYNTGAGWRKIVEEMHQVATTRDWFKTKGRHPIHAGDRPMELGPEPEVGAPRVPENGNGVNGGRGLPVLGERDRARIREKPPHAGSAQMESGCGSGADGSCGCGGA